MCVILTARLSSGWDCELRPPLPLTHPRPVPLAPPVRLAPRCVYRYTPYLFRAAPQQMGPTQQCLRKRDGAPLPPQGLRASWVCLPTWGQLLQDSWPMSSLETCSRHSPGTFPGCFCPDSCLLLLNQGPTTGATQLWGCHSFPSVPVCLRSNRAERPGMGWGWLPFVPHTCGLLLSGACGVMRQEESVTLPTVQWVSSLFYLSVSGLVAVSKPTTGLL